MAFVTYKAPSTKRRPDTADGWTSSGLTALVIRGLEARRPDLLPAALTMPECTHTARAPAGFKRDLLTKAYEGGGAALILDLREDLRRVGFDPILHVLLRSRTPAILAEKWGRFERYTHSTNRLELVPAGPAAFETHRYKNTGGSTHPAEDLLMLGVVATLLEQIGAEGVSVRLTPKNSEPLALIDAGRVVTGDGELPVSTAVGCIDWQGFAAPGRIDCDTDRLIVYGGNEDQPVTGAITSLISTDVARVWTWSVISQELAQPVRSLQRSLSKEETSLSELVRAVRVREACRLLEEDKLSLTQIGFWCGFSDSAHFSRDFKRSLGMPPSVYRASSVG
ncbi:MAG: helix-turn-helix transcriptional regulator [Rhodobiaceae bacterium]|nr:helix-turn-helix transcriptional regulator [Rhodobiaceae bacterium]